MEELLKGDYKYHVDYFYNNGSKSSHMLKSKDMINDIPDENLEKIVLLCEFRKNDIPNLIQFLINCEQKL